MTFDLSGLQHDGRISFTITAWCQLLRLAEEFDWSPMGTQLESELDWSGRYDTNEGQVVQMDDALNLADAIEHALKVIPKERTAPSFITYMGIDVTDALRQNEIASANRRYKEAGSPKRLGEDALVLTLEEYEQSNQVPDILIVDRRTHDILWQPNPIDEFSGEAWRNNLLEFIVFCRQGAFEIW